MWGQGEAARVLGSAGLVLAVGCHQNNGAASPVAPSNPPGEEKRVTREATPEEVRKIQRRVEAAVLGTVELSAPILARGEIARVAIEGDRVGVVAIDQKQAERIAANMEKLEPRDTVSPRWFRRHGQQGRIFVTIDQGSFLLNFSPESGYSIEPGSTDASWRNKP